MTLTELTGQNSGIIVYRFDEGYKYIAVNWQYMKGIIPRINTNTIYSGGEVLKETETLVLVDLPDIQQGVPALLKKEKWNKSQIVDFLHEKILLYSDIDEKLNIDEANEAMVYLLNLETVVIAPLGWP